MRSTEEQRTHIYYDPANNAVVIIHPKLGGVHVIKEKKPTELDELRAKLYAIGRRVWDSKCRVRVNPRPEGKQ